MGQTTVTRKGTKCRGKTRGRYYRDISFFLSTSYPTHAHCSTMGGLSIKLDKTGMTDQRWAENKGSRRRSKSIPGRSRGHLTMGRNLLGRRVNVYGGVDRCKNIMEMFARTHGRTEAWVLTCCGFWWLLVSRDTSWADLPRQHPSF